METPRNSTARRLLWGIYILGCKMSSTYHRAHGVENPGYVRLSNARTSFKGVEGALTVNDALALQAFAEELCQSCCEVPSPSFPVGQRGQAGLLTA